jgi:hypothetical protein
MVFATDDSDRFEILDRIVWQGLQMRCDDDRVGAHQQCVAVGRRLMNRCGSDNAICARPIFNDHRGVPDHAQLVRNDPRQQIGCAAGRKSDHNMNRAVRKIGCGARRPGENGSENHERKERAKA